MGDSPPRGPRADLERDRRRSRSPDHRDDSRHHRRRPRDGDNEEELRDASNRAKAPERKAEEKRFAKALFSKDKGGPLSRRDEGSSRREDRRRDDRYYDRERRDRDDRGDRRDRDGRRDREDGRDKEDRRDRSKRDRKEKDNDNGGAEDDIASKFGPSSVTSASKSNSNSSKAQKPAAVMPQSNQPMIIVTVNDRLGTKAQIPCFASDNVGLFKAQVAARIGRKPHEIMLKRQGERPFKDMLTLEDYAVSNGVQIDLEIDTGD